MNEINFGKEISYRIEMLVNKGMAAEQFAKYKSDVLWYCNDRDIVYYGDTILDKIKEKIAEYEEKSGNKIYLVSIDWEPYSDNILASCLFVSSYVSEWVYERESMTRNMAYAYVINLTNEDLSESGSIVYNIVNGDFRRVG